MPRSDPVRLVVALLVLVAALAAVPALGGSAGAAGPAAAERYTTQGDFDRAEFRITVHANGSATWTFLYKQTLSNESERQEFEAYARNFNENETELYVNFQNRARSLVSAGENATGREMEASAFSKRAYTQGPGVEGNRGIVEMSFRWSNFAAQEGDRLVVGDIFEGGLYIGPDQKLVFQRGEGLVFVNVDPQADSMSAGDSLPDSESVTWQGEEEFNDNRPQVVLAPPGEETPTTVSGTPTPGGPGNDGDDLGILPYLALVVILVLGGGAAYVYRSRGDDGAGGNPAAATSEGGDGDDGAPGLAGATADPPEPAISDEELLSDDDRVMKMLEERGGRMKQVNIVEETGWSKSKVSMLLSDMEDEGHISKLRVGRENIVSIAGQEPEAAGSPFDDEE